MNPLIIGIVGGYGVDVGVGSVLFNLLLLRITDGGIMYNSST